MTDEPAIQSPFEEQRQEIRRASGWTLLGGFLMIFMGIFAISVPLATTLAVSLVIGWVFVFTGIFDGVRALKELTSGGQIVELLLALAYIAVGFMILRNPEAGAATFTLFIAAVILFHGIAEILFALATRPRRGWGWVMLAGILGVVAAIMIIAKLPDSAPWVISLWVGFKIMTSGFTLVLLGGAGRAVTEA
jgi:uncharacterized membrane protein HdeD (DUF308 family)